MEQIVTREERLAAMCEAAADRPITDREIDDFLMELHGYDLGICDEAAVVILRLKLRLGREL